LVLDAYGLIKVVAKNCWQVTLGYAFKNMVVNFNNRAFVAHFVAKVASKINFRLNVMRNQESLYCIKVFGIAS